MSPRGPISTRDRSMRGRAPIPTSRKAGSDSGCGRVLSPLAGVSPAGPEPQRLRGPLSVRPAAAGLPALRSEASAAGLRERARLRGRGPRPRHSPAGSRCAVFLMLHNHFEPQAAHTFLIKDFSSVVVLHV